MKLLHKKNWLVLLGILVVLGLAGCGNSETETEEPVESKTLEEVYTQMIEEAELPEMLRLEDDYITNYYGAELDTLEEYVFAVPEDALLAETIIMVKMKEGESTDAVKKLLENLIKQKKLELENYLPEQYKIVEKSEIVTTGDYIYLLISSKQEALNEIASTYIK